MLESNRDTQYVKLLEDFRGSFAQVWSYEPSLKRLVMRLSFKDSDQVLFIFSVGTERFSGNLSWHESDIIIQEDQNVYGETVTYLKDQIANFELLSSGGIALRLGTKSENIPTWQ